MHYAYDALFVRHAQDLLIEDRRAQDAIEVLRAGRDPARHIRAPIYRSRRAAVQNALRAFLAVLISAVLFSLGGWPLRGAGRRLGGGYHSVERQHTEPRYLRGRRRHRDADRRAACGRDASS